MSVAACAEVSTGNIRVKKDVSTAMGLRRCAMGVSRGEV
jgi:hypothetical protein